MDEAANLIFLDQFGVKCVDKKRFLDLIQIPKTDILFFISSSIFNRFATQDSISNIIGITHQMVKDTPPSQIHQLVTQTYDSFIPNDLSYCVAPFSIKKGPNIYGLIFGSGHPLGIEKFLEVCWNKDNISGEANFDIEGLGNINQLSLFENARKVSKLEDFQNRLKENILNGTLSTDLDIFIFAINNGFIARHITPIIKELKKDNRISLSYPSFKCSTVWKTWNRPPKKVILNKR